MMKIIVVVVCAVLALAQGVCRPGWIRHGNSCYLFIASPPETWTTATAYCTGTHGHLAEIDTQDENDFMRLHLLDMRLPYSRWWIGGEDYEQEGYWVWANSGNRIRETFWAPGEPNEDSGRDEDCINLICDLRFFWNDEECDQKWSFICEIEDNVNIIG